MRDFSIIPATMNPSVDPDLQREADFFMKWGYLVVEDDISMEMVATLREALDDTIGHKHGASRRTCLMCYQNAWMKSREPFDGPRVSKLRQQGTQL